MPGLTHNGSLSGPLNTPSGPWKGHLFGPIIALPDPTIFRQTLLRLSRSIPWWISEPVESGSDT
jgi:hypothetical protein